MGDTVQRLMEEMVPELEDLEKKKILSKNEIQSLVSHRQDFEYKLRRKHVSKLDFLRAIQYELNLTALKERRRSRLGIDKKGVSDFASMKRVAFLYERALRKFHHDVTLWKQYLEYSRRIGSHHAISKILPRAIQLNSKDISLWLLHASWESDTNNNIDGARTILQRALRLNAGARQAWLAFFQLEMRFIAKMLERRRRMGLIAAPAGADADASPDFDLRFTGGVAAAPTDDTKDEMSKKQMEALLTCLLPRAIFKNATASAALKNDLAFRLEFLRCIPSSLSAALSALEPNAAPERVDDDQTGVSADAQTHKLSLASFAYNHNPADALLTCFLRYNGMSIAQAARAAHSAGAVEDGDDDEDKPQVSNKPYNVDFLPLCNEILESVRRDFPHEVQGVRLQAEFALIQRRLEIDALEASGALSDAEADLRSPAQVAFDVFEQAVAPSALESMRAAAAAYYAAHKQEVDAQPDARQADRLQHVDAFLWQSYADFAYGVLKATPDDMTVQLHLQKLYERVAKMSKSASASSSSRGVLTERILRQHVNFLLETGQASKAIAILEQALQTRSASAGASSPDFSRSLGLWLRYLDLHVKIHAFHSAQAAKDDQDETASHNSKKRKKATTAAAAAPTGPAANFPHVTTSFVLSLFESALGAVQPHDQMAVFDQLLEFQRGQMMAASTQIGVGAGGSRPLVAAYLSVHATYQRVLHLIPQPRGVDQLKVRYLNWMRIITCSDVYAAMQGERGAVKAKTAQQQQQSKKQKRAAALADSDDELDVESAAAGGAWPSAVPALSLSPFAALRHMVDSLLSAPPVTLQLLQACIQAEDALNPAGGATAPALPSASSPAAASTAAAAQQLHNQRMKELYERALLAFGATSPELWFSYLSWARGLQTARAASAQLQLINPNQIHFRATRELKPEYQAHWAELQSLLIQ